MNQRDELDRMLSAWVDDPYTPPAPRYLGEVLERTRRTPQRPAWASLERWLPMVITLRHPVLPLPARLLAIGLALVLALLATLAVVPLLGGASPFPASITSTGNGLIAFSRDGDVFVVEPEPGAEPRVLIGGPDVTVGPAWSPDGRKLLYFVLSDDGEIPFIANADGTEPVALTDGPLTGGSSLSWAPDGSAVAFAWAPDGEPSRIALFAADGSGEVAVNRGSPGPWEFADQPALRPGPGGPARQEILWRDTHDPARSRLLHTAWSEEGGRGGVVLDVSDLDGPPRTTGFDGEFDFMHMTWSPDGEWFAFDTLQDLGDRARDGNGLRVHAARFLKDEGSQRKSRDAMLEYDPEADDEGWPIWSPDGSRLAFESYDEGRARLVIMGVGKDGPAAASGTAAATEPFFTFMPGRLGYAWAPDGSSLVLANLYLSPDPNAYLVDPATGELTALAWRSDDEWPSWQPVSP